VTGDPHGEILDSAAAYYSSKLAEHGPTAQGVDWNSRGSHELRHRQFLRLLGGFPDASILDLGCGFGDFLRFLRTHGHRGNFIGYDIAPDMITEARRLHGDGPQCQWRVGAEPKEIADFAIASGIFNIKGDTSTETWTRYVQRTIDALARAGHRGFGFNMLSLSSDADRRRPDLYYADPVEMFGYCLSRFGRSVALLQDYQLYEFTVVIRRGGGAA
jgi:SAM-dependent methyltransferase